MTTTSIVRIAALLAATQTAVGCSRFVWHEDPFTPDPAPANETLVAGNDTTYVLRGPTYYLLASQRAALWNREVLDDVAWRYRALFGDAPPVIAVRLDSVATRQDSATWRGVPLATVALRRRGEQASGNGKQQQHDKDRPVLEDSARVRLFAGAMLSATAAETWLRARAMNVTRAADSQPGGPLSNEPPHSAALPAWIEAGALRILGNSGASERSAAELRADAKNIVPLASLFTVGFPAKPNALEIVRGGADRYDLDDEDLRQETLMRARVHREGGTAGVSPLFIAQSVSVLSFIHEREPEMVARLTDELARGASVPEVLASSTTLPHDVAGLDAAWRDWLKRTAKRDR
jgi:hypothetical protein